MADGLSVLLHDATAQVAPPAWQVFTGQHGLHPGWRWPVVRAAARARHGRLLAATVHDAGRTIALVAGRRRAGLLNLECPGSSALPGIAVAPDAGAGLLVEVVAALEAALRLGHGTRVAAVIYRQIDAGALPAVLRGWSVSYEGSPIAVLDNDFGGHDGYLRTLSKSRRGDQTRLRRRFDADPTIHIGLGPGHHIDPVRLAELALRASRRQHRTWWPPPERTPTPVIAALLADPDTLALTYRDSEGELLACMMLYRHPTTPILGVWGGVGTGEGARSGIWFDAIGRGVEWALDSGCQRLIGGKGVSALKADLGFRLLPQWAVLRRPRRPSRR